MINEPIKNSHYRDMAEQIQLKEFEVFRFQWINGDPGDPEATGIYKCSLCGEAGTFIKFPMHIKEQEPDVKDSWLHPSATIFKKQEFWCAGRPDLKR